MKALTYTLKTAGQNSIEISNKRVKEKILIDTGIIGWVWQYKVAIADIIDLPWDKIRFKDPGGKIIENTKHISYELDKGDKFKIDFVKKGVPVKERINYLRKAYATGRWAQDWADALVNETNDYVILDQYSHEIDYMFSETVRSKLFLYNLLTMQELVFTGGGLEYKYHSYSKGTYEQGVAEAHFSRKNPYHLILSYTNGKKKRISLPGPD